MLTAREGREHERGAPLLVRGVRGSPPKKFCFLALLCAFLMGFRRLGPDFSHDFLLEKMFLGA